jgi:hypothetical protein
MSSLKQPDWTEPMGTGLWGLGFKLRLNHYLVLLSSRSTISGENPERLWPFILTQDRQRSIREEESVAKRADLLPLLERQKLGNEEIMCVREKNLNDILSVLGTQPVRNVADG